MQRGKWDPLVWPWDSSTFNSEKTTAQVGNALRSQVQAQLAGLSAGGVAASGAERLASTLPQPVRGAVTALTRPAVTAGAAIAGTIGRPAVNASGLLQAWLFAGNPVLEEVAGGHPVLAAAGHLVPGIERAVPGGPPGLASSSRCRRKGVDDAYTCKT